MECVFCNLDRERALGETKNTYTIFSDPYLVKGHCLVIPKKHIEKLSELTNNELEDLLKQVVNIQENLLKKFGGRDIRINYRPFQKEDDLKVDHLHVHLQPREFEDELYEESQIYEKSIFRKLNHFQFRKLKKGIFR